MDKTNPEEQEEIKITQPLDFKKYLVIAVTIFVTFCCCILFFFMLYRYNGLTNFWKKLIQSGQSIVIGFVIAYLLNPVMTFCERYLFRFLEKRLKKPQKAKKMARSLAIFLALAFLVGIITLLIVAVVPSISNSIRQFNIDLPEEIRNFTAWLDDVSNRDTPFATILKKTVESIETAVTDFFEGGLFTQLTNYLETYLSSITSGVIYGVKFVLNFLVGIIVSVYVMANKEKFAGQAKKMLYAFFKPARANVILETAHVSNEIFGGFISGKILDSAIIGVLAYIVLSIMRMPDTTLVAVIIGVTNIIPFFGPIIGAVPSLFIIVLQNPVQGLYFLIFVLILQQIDGNIIGPKILGDSTGLSPFWVVFAILVFGGFWGFLGMLLGVPIMAVIYYIAGKVVDNLLRKRGLPTDTRGYIRMTGVDKETNQIIYGDKKSRKPKKKKVATEEKDNTRNEK